MLVQHGPMPQTRRRLDLATLSLGCQRLVWGSGVVGIGLCTRELYWDPLTRTIASRPPDTSCGRTFECQAGVSKHAACIAHSNAVLALCACLVLFVLRVCVIGSSVLPLVPLRSRKRIQQRPKRMLRAAAFIGACSLLQIAQKSRNSCGLNGRGCGCIWTIDSRRWW